MEILKIHEDKPTHGFVTMDVEMTEEENNRILSYAVNDILKKQIESMTLKESMTWRCCFDCQAEIDEETIKEFPDTEICRECMDTEI